MNALPGTPAGAMLAIVAGATAAVGPLSAVPLASLLGAAIAATIVYRLATLPGRAMSTAVLLLAGVTLNSFFSALIMFVQYIADFAQVYRATRWLMGDLDVGGFQPILAALPLVAAAFVMFAFLPASLNLLSVDADAAAVIADDQAARAGDVVAAEHRDLEIVAVDRGHQRVPAQQRAAVHTEAVDAIVVELDRQTVELRRNLDAAPALLRGASLYGFYDLAAAFKNNQPGRESAATAGFGLAVQHRRVSSIIELAKPLTHPDVEGRKELALFAEVALLL